MLEDVLLLLFPVFWEGVRCKHCACKGVEGACKGVHEFMHIDIWIFASLIIDILSVTVHVFNVPTTHFPFWLNAVGWSWKMLDCFYWFYSVLQCHCALFPFPRVFVGASLVLQQQLYNLYMFYIYTPSSCTFWLMALSVNSVSPGVEGNDCKSSWIDSFQHPHTMSLRRRYESLFLHKREWNGTWRVALSPWGTARHGKEVQQSHLLTDGLLQFANLILRGKSTGVGKRGGCRCGWSQRVDG